MATTSRLATLLVRIAGETGQLESDLDEGMQRAEERIQRGQERLASAATAIGAGIGVALGVGIANSLEVEAANDKLAAQLGVDEIEAERMGQVAGEVYAAGWGESLEDINNAIAGIYRNIGEGNDEWLRDTTEKAMAIADVFEQDVGAVTAAVGQMLNTGMADSAEEAFDVLTTGFQMGIDKAGDFLDTLNEYGTQFRSLGVDGQMMLGLVSQGLQAGARDADTVADALKEFAIEAVAGSDKIKDAWKELGLSSDEMFRKLGEGGESAAEVLTITLKELEKIEDPIERNALAVELFGTKAEDLGQALYALDPTTAVQAIGDVGAASEQMAQTVADNPARALETFKRQATQKLGEIAGGFTQWAMQNQQLVKPLAIGLGVLAGAILAVRGAQMAWTTAQAIWRGVTMGATAVQWAWNAALSANPIGLIIMLVAGLVAGIVLLYTKSETAREIINGVFRAIWGFIRAPYDWVTENWPTIQEKLSAPFRWAAKFIGDRWNDAKNAGVTFYNWIRDLPGKIIDALSRIGDILFAPFKAGFNAIARGWNNSVGKIGFKVPGWVPGVGGKEFSIPKIPLLNTGGLVTRTGLAMVHEGETVLPAGTAPLPAGAHGGAAAGGVEITFDLVGADEDLKRLIRRIVRVDGGGSVQRAFGAA